MKKQIILLVLILLLVQIVWAAKTIYIKENDLVRLNPNAIDPDGDILQFLYTSPINSSGEWQTMTGDAGVYNVSVLVTDGSYVIENVVIVVNSTNRPPTLRTINNITVNEGQELVIPVYANDEDNDNLTITYSGWIKKGNYKTSYDDEGIHTVTVSVSDGEYEVWQDVFIEVLNTNRAPVILGPDEITANEGETIIILPDTIDLDHDKIKYTYSGWIDTNSYTTNFNEAGEYSVRVYADDGQLKSYKDIKIIINDVNREPQIVELNDLEVNEGDTINLQPEILDLDGDDIFITYSGFMTTNTYQTTFEDAGEYKVYLNITDGKSTIKGMVNVVIKDVNRAPRIKPDDIYIKEGESYTLIPEAYDPDGDELSYSFSGYSNTSSINPNFDDQGAHYVSITVSDGKKLSFAKYTIHVENVNRPPKIIIPDRIYVKETEEVFIEPELIDPDGDDSTYVVTGWFNASYHRTTYDDSGEHKIKIIATDGKDFSESDVEIVVENVNRPPKASASEMYVNESDLVELIPDVMDPDGDELIYTYSWPLDEFGRWQTTFEDSGEYIVNYSVSDGGYISKNKVKIYVKDIDRPPLFKRIESVNSYEDEMITFELFAVDQDNDNITYSIENPPEGSKINGDFFSWEPGYEYVQVDNSYFSKFLRFFGIDRNKKTLKVNFIAKGKEAFSTQEVTFTIKHRNRAPVLNEIEDIEVNEGDKVEIIPDAWDLDGDKVTYEFSGWIESGVYVTNFEDAGEYVVDVTATDGKLSDTKKLKVTVNNVNRPPTLQEVSSLVVNEGEDVRIGLTFSDPDGDKLVLSSQNLPDWSYLSEDAFIYSVPYDAVDKLNKEIKVTIIVTDTQGESDSIDIPITINHINRGPEIVSAVPEKEIIQVFQGGVVQFSVDAYDPDGDDVTSVFSFSPFDKYQVDKVSRRFVNLGKKKVSLKVTDGMSETKKEWVVEVLPIKAKRAVPKPNTKTTKTPKNTIDTQVQFDKAPTGTYTIGDGTEGDGTENTDEDSQLVVFTI